MKKPFSIPDDARTSKLESFNKLLTIMNELRENCPWDKKQTLETLRHLTIEEIFELSDAILDGDMRQVKNELGDLMLHVVFYCKIAEEDNEFHIGDMINNLCEKLIRRHPHIYGGILAEDEDTVKANWEKIKLKENGNKSVLGGVPRALPALVKAMRIQEKARGVGFDWKDKSQVWDKVEEELREFKAEVNTQEKIIDKEKSQSEFGDLLFSLINYSRFLGINAEDALENTNRKFIERFQYLEKMSQKTRNQNEVTLVIGTK